MDIVSSLMKLKLKNVIRENWTTALYGEQRFTLWTIPVHLEQEDG